MLSMNYVGGSAILDRGDGPAQAILDKNARSLAQRVANETKEELEKVMNRVENIYDSYESSTQAFFETQANMEYVDDIAELEELIKDSIKKKKYQQQITIFIVGYENVCGQKLRLLQQVNEFFMDNTRKEDEEDLPPPSPDIDVEDCSNKIEESLETAKHLADRLAEINSDIVDWLTNYAINKASTKAIALVDAKGKKKLESALSKAKEDMKTVTEQLKAAQAASEEKDDLVQLYLKQLEGKSLEIQKFKTAAEVAKKTIVQLEEDLDMNQVNLSAKQERIKQLSNELKKAQLDVSQSNYLSNLNENRAQEKDKEFMDFSVFKVRLEELQNQLERNKFDMEAKKRELQNAHEDQMRELLQSHKQELETLRADNETQINQLKGISQDSRMLDKESTQITEEELEKEESKESRPSTKTNKAQGPPKVAVRTNQQKNIPPKSTAIKNEAKVSTKPVKETAEPEPIEEHVPEKPAAKKTGRSVETISDAGDNFNDNFDLNDEQAWTSIPSDQVTTRFSQYRKLAKKRLEEMEEQLNITMTKTQRKVSTLKSQFHEHKSKWEAERKVLVEQVEQAQKLQNEAEKEADVAMTQLEEFINEQERLEEEEEVKRQEVVKGVSRPIPIPSVELEEEKSKSSLLTPQEKTTPEDASSDVEAVAKEIVDEADGAAPTQPSQPDAELSNLMQQTDDAKVQEMNSRITSGAMSAPPEMDALSRSHSEFKEAQKLYTTPIHGKTEDEIHLSSSMSRASLRNQYKNKLEEVRAAVEDRRAKSPAVSIPSQRSLEEDQLIDEDDGATGRAATDEAKEKRETSKLSRQKTERLKANHPAVGEFLKTYQGIVQFKEAISKLMVDREMLQPGQIVSDLETMEFDPEAHVEPQLEYMSQNVYKVLEEILTVLGTILLADREPNISSLSHVAASREPSQFPQREKSADSGRGPTTTRASQYSNKSSDLDKQALQELQEQYQKLQQELTAQAKKHEDQLRHNTVVMMEMQDTINELHRELSNLGRSSSRLRPQSDANSAQGTESSVMFTRLDSERNAKIMKRAVNEQKLAPETYKDAVNKMDDYVSLPAERLAHLVRKYVHHCRMKQIEDNVKKSRSLNENVFDILDKMEALQNQRAKRWADSMDEMGSERARLAALLMQTLESIEQESGIFLIKPMYSYRGREITERLGGKLARPNRPRHASPKRESINVSQNAPAPTPSHNTKGLRTYGQSQQVGDGYLPFAHSNQPLEGDQQGIMGNSMMWAGGATPNKQTWSMNASIVRGDPESFLSSQNPNLMNTPRILELDINRMMIGQNNISSKVLPTSLSDDRLINAAQNNLRSYVTVNRPTANQSGLTTNRPSSYGSSLLKEGVLPSSPINQSQGRARTSDPDLSRNMTNTPPLPPISTHSNNVRETPAEPPRSPPGSSIRVSPPRLVCL